MNPLGLRDELRAALVVGSECWGYLCLHRANHPLGFTESETAPIAGVAPHLAHALRQAVLLHGSPGTGDTHEPGVVLLAEDLSLVAVTPEASLLLSLVEERHPPGRSNSTTICSPSRQASIGIAAGRAVVPQICCASRSKSRNGSVRTNIVLTSSCAA
jgi:hypothetical protein